MKKILTLVLFAAVTMAAQAQIDFGVKGGLNVAHMSFSKDVIDPSNQAGFFVGPTVKFTLPVVGLGIDASALYDQRSTKVELNVDNKNVEDNVKLQSLQIPVNVRFGFGVGDIASIFFFVGPQFGFNLGDKATKVLDNVAEWTLKSSNLSANVGAGAMLLKHLQVSLNYNFALGKTGEMKVNESSKIIKGLSNGDYDAKINAWQLSVAYFF